MLSVYAVPCATLCKIFFHEGALTAEGFCEETPLAVFPHRTAKGPNSCKRQE